MAKTKPRTLVFNVKTLSITDLREMFPRFFQDDAFADRSFCYLKPVPGLYEVGLEPVEGSLNKKYKDQLSLLPEGYEVLSMAILVQVVTLHYISTGEKLFGDCIVRSSTLITESERALLMEFDYSGPRIRPYPDSFHSSRMGLSFGRFLGSPYRRGRRVSGIYFDEYADWSNMLEKGTNASS